MTPRGALARLFQIQPGEGRTLGLVVALMFCSVAGLTIGESGINALFFDRIGPDSLPVMYLAQGAVGLAGMLLLSGALGRFEQRRTYVVLPVLLAIVVGIERLIAASGAEWIYRAMWLTTTVAYLVQAVYLWGSAGLVTDARRAKRLFPLFGAGAILGAVAGGVATRPLASAIGTPNLLVVWSIALVATSALCALALGVRARSGRRRVRSRPSTLAELRRGLAYVRRSPLLIWISIASVLFSILFYSLFLPFAQAATARFPDPDDLAGFLGIYWAAVTGVAFVASILLANRLLGWFGAAAIVVVLSFLYAGAFGTLLVTSTFGTLVATRFGVNVWLQGVCSPAWETLINVTPEHRRDQTRAFLNGGPAQIGTAIAGVVQLVGRDALTPRQLSVIGLATALLAIVVGWRIRRSYTAALVAAIHAGRPPVFDAPLPNTVVAIRHDAQAVALATAALADPDPRIRRLASQLLASADDERASQALRAALDDDDPMVRAHSVSALAARGRLGGPDLDRALGDVDPEVRRAAVRGLPPGHAPPALAHDESVGVAAAAAVNLLDGPSRPEAVEALERLLSDGDPDVRLRAVRELGDASPDDVVALVSRPLEDAAPAVRAAALETLVAAGPLVAVPVAVQALPSPDPIIRRAALEALDHLDVRGFETQLADVVARSSSVATFDGSIAAGVPLDGEALELLRSALLSRARRHALVALSALSVMSGDRSAIRVALDVLADGPASQLANALETIEAAASPVARALLALWEPPAIYQRTPIDATASVDAAAAHDDPFIRACAELTQSVRSEGDVMPRSRTSMSPMELVLVLRKIPLFAELAPVDLQRVAGICEERTHTSGDVIGSEGEIGDEMHVVLDGLVSVVRPDGTIVARRGPGDVVGEMSVITRAPRVASLVADGDVRTLRIGHREFESMVRERPEIALAIMRVLAERLGAMTTETLTERA